MWALGWSHAFENCELLEIAGPAGAAGLEQSVVLYHVIILIPLLLGNIYFCFCGGDIHLLRIFTAEGTIITEDDNYAEEAFINCCRYKHVHSLRLGSSNFSRGWVDGMMTKLLNSKWDTVHYTTKHTTAPAITTPTHIRSPRLKKKQSDLDGFE